MSFEQPPAPQPQSWPAPTPPGPASAGPSEPSEQPRHARIIGLVVTLILLAVAVGVLAFFIITQVQTQNALEEAESTIEDLQQRVDEQQATIDRQQEAVDAKDEFRKSAQAFVDVAKRFDGLPFGDIVPLDTVEAQIQDAWEVRWEPRQVADIVSSLDVRRAGLEQLLADAATQTASNATGTQNEATIDELGSGFVRSYWESADAFCGGDVLACVPGDDPYSVHFDADSDAQGGMTDWIRTGIAYHEFAHVLQFTNPEATDAALGAFGDDWETMADCYALTTLPGWTLDHEVPIDAYSWWEVSVGYGYTCDEPQRQVIRDWVAATGFRFRPMSQ
ncbi:MAG: hypothetical protein J7480_08670 [Microbacteriaceae bacterium]|nr:hypothetical protein [Microbacteriaceae bacterium]